ncbi:hypothetical protein L6164_023857 [Bauhinia variegata]|uniref:Uncharacterized protein n=1 Tax=Bauhinia variegata TaxID=167791 RepID=A0ACB9MPU7_BAUVA|nr:hypothetical protein L6164_023857 [Bauhinia variegata]
MATNSLHYIQHHHHCLSKPQHPTESPFHSIPTTLFLKPTTINTSLSHSISFSSSDSDSIVAFSLSPTTSATPSTSSDQTISFELLRQHLSAKNFREADEETRRLLIVLAGEATQKRGYVFFSEVQFIPAADLKAIDDLWRQYSDNKFGYSVQKRIFDRVDGDFTKLFLKLGWMKKLDTEVEQYNYRSFPTEFIWEPNDDTPEGHLPLTNALRGTQLLNNILNHPAFDTGEEKIEEDKAGDDGGAVTGLKDNNSSSKPFTKTIFKPDYSF